FVLDPQGEFAKIKADSKMLDILEKLGKRPKIYGLHNLVLSGNTLFKKVLSLSGFLDELGIVHEDNKARAANQIDMMLQGRHPIVSTKGAIPPWDFHKREVFNLIWEALKTDQVLIRIYSTKDLMERVRSTLQSADQEYMYKLWKSTALLFTYKQGTESVEIKKLTKGVIEAANGQIIIIDLSDVNVPTDTLWNDRIRMIVINEFLQSLSNEAQYVYKEGNSLNTLVVIDEAHRLAPREPQNNVELETIKTTLKDAVRTTRKFGLGWMFISQTLSGLDREIINQLRIYVFGFGLAYGTELQGLREIIGGNDEAIRLYQLFKDPQSNPHQKEYSFMTIGPTSPLSFSGIPLFFQALSYPDSFIKDNISTFSG
ncbi:MAG: ATPase, partial [Nitrososphaera sp.]